MIRQQPVRQRIREGVILTTFLLFPNLMHYFSPYAIDVQIMFRGRSDPLRSPWAGARHCPYESLSDYYSIPWCRFVQGG